MNEENVSYISAKLHPEIDKFLIEGIKKIPKRDRSRTYREALKTYFEDAQKNG